jgi:hypothetical protein
MVRGYREVHTNGTVGLAEIASHIAQLKGEARAYFSDPNYNTLKLRRTRR